MDRGLISVIIPVYNTEKYLRQCIESVINQTYSNLQIIIVNDGSTDNSGNICDEYQKEDLRIKVIHQENLGVSVARNHGLQYATGDWISFVDSDDILIKDAYENLIKCSTDAQMIMGKIMLLDEDGKITEPDKFLNKQEIPQIEFLNDLFLEEQYSYLGYPVDKLYRREVIIKNALKFDNEIKLNEDRLFVLEYMRYCKKATICNHVIYLYRQKSKELVTEAKRNKIVTNSEMTVIDAFNKMQKIGKTYSDNLYFLICRKSFESALDLLSRLPENDNEKQKKVENFLKESMKKCLKNPDETFGGKIKILIHYIAKK